MTKKIVLPLVVTVIVILTGYFVVQLSSSPAFWCRPKLNFECEIDAQVACGGGDYFTREEGSWCNGTTCRSAHEVYCETRDGSYRPNGVIYCDEIGGCGEPN